MSGNVTRMIMRMLTAVHIDITFDSLHHFIRKAAHFSEYFVQGLLVCLAEKKAPLMKNNAAVIILWMVITPLCDELIQHYTAQRYGAFSDVLLDMSGFACAAVLFYLIRRKKR